MNYLKIYNSLIEKRKLNKPTGYTEIHHIIPKCVGGTNEKSNLIKLTAKEHFICHLLLTKIYIKYTFEWYKVVHAFMMMKTSSLNQLRYNSNYYKYLKEGYSKYLSLSTKGNKNNNFNHTWIHNDKLEKTKNILKSELNFYLSNGWEIGSVINWKTYKYKKELKEQKKQEKLKKYEEKVKLYRYYYKLYDNCGWEKFKKITNYKFSRQYLVMACSKYLKDFKPQNGKKRGK